MPALLEEEADGGEGGISCALDVSRNRAAETELPNGASSISFPFIVSDQWHAFVLNACRLQTAYNSPHCGWGLEFGSDRILGITLG